MITPEEGRAFRVPLSRSQQNLYHGVVQDGEPTLYLVGKSYRFCQLELSRFLAALQATILNNPVQLCVLEAPPTNVDYPDLVPRLRSDDLVRVRAEDESQIGHDELSATWSAGILGKPLVRYTVRTDAMGYVSGLDVHTHHILLDGGATGLVEADLARYLRDGLPDENPCITAGLTKLAEAHRREATRVAEALQRLAGAVQRELAEEARDGGSGQGPNAAPGVAVKGVLRGSVRISGSAYDALLGLSETEQVPVNVLVAAAAVAVDASLRQSTESLLVHAVDNRFGDPDLNVATCLVNSVAHAVRFAAFASVQDVVRTLDRGYVRAVRRRWLREEHHRRMYLAINRTSHADALTLNFIREAYAPQLRPFLSETPVATAIGPVEGMTVACVQDEQLRTLELAVWHRADLPARKTPSRVAERIAAALEAIPTMWHHPIAMTVDEWLEVSPEGDCSPADSESEMRRRPVPAWFLDREGDVDEFLAKRSYVYPWLGWLVQSGAMPGDVLVFADDNTDKTIDLLIACHLAGCGYSVCDRVDGVAARAEAIAGHDGQYSAHSVDVAGARIGGQLDDALARLVGARIEQVMRDNQLGTKTAYIMPTSGSTGNPKLVRISHASLALFCAAARQAYGWGRKDIVLQCAPLTSDISVEEIFVSALGGSELVRTTSMKTGALDALTGDLVATRATVVDLPTAVWHLLCEDRDAIEAIRGSRLQQIVIGGEAIRSSAVDKWVDSGAAQGISLISTYGPTETTVVVTYLPIARDGVTVSDGTRLRLGRPVVPGSVFIAFGEVVIVGELVSSGYLGSGDRGFGTVTTRDGARHRAFATSDRTALDAEGFPVFAGRKDAIVKVSGKRVDTAEVTARIAAGPAVADVAVELHNGSLGVWFETRLTRAAAEDAGAVARIKHILKSLGVSSFFVVGVPHIPRKSNGNIDSDKLPTIPQRVDAVGSDAEAGQQAAGLAAIWSRHLASEIRPDSSLLAEGTGSLDLIRILPDTRDYLGRQISLLDLISADTAANLVSDLADTGPTGDCWMDVGTAAEIDRDLGSIRHARSAAASRLQPAGEGSIVVLGASGILGTGFAQAVLDLKKSGALRPEVVLVTRSALPEHNPWVDLASINGVRIEQLSRLGPAELEKMIRVTGARTVVNCVGNTNVLVPYRELRPANLELASTIAEVCTSRATRLVHLSTFVVNADAAVPRVTDPREAPYPYVASKALAELVVAAAPGELDFTIARLPRVLGHAHQMRASSDILVSVADACKALGAFPSVALIEEVTTGQAVAEAILGLLPESSGSAGLGRGITVVRGEAVPYAELLGEYARDQLDPFEWKQRLDQSDWAKRNPRRWAVIDAWITLGTRLGNRSYADYLAAYPTIAVGVESVAELVAKPQSVRTVLHTQFAAPASRGVG